MVNQVIYGDSKKIMRYIPSNSIDLCLTDPPYGANNDKGIGGYGESKTDRHYKDNWDNERPNKKIFNEILRISKKVIIFGGNFFTDLLPVNACWIVWDKKGDIAFNNPYGDCELAWTNIDRKSVKKYQVIQQGFVAEEKTRWHPTQKPVKLFEMILMDFSNEGDLILDPFLGSGTTAVAAKELGRRYIGIEISPEYYRVSNERLRQEVLF